MNKLIIAAFIGLSGVVVTSAQAPAPATPTRAAAPIRPASSELTATAEHDLFARYCVNCHSEKAKAAGMDSARKLTIDNIDFSNLHPQGEID